MKMPHINRGRVPHQKKKIGKVTKSFICNKPKSITYLQLFML